MTKIVVDFNELRKYSKNLYDDSIQFGTITKNMQDIIDSLKERGWSGYDADRFIHNAVTYLEDLRVVKEAIHESALIVQRKNKGYSDRVEKYFETVKFKEENKHE